MYTRVSGERRVYSDLKILCLTKTRIGPSVLRPLCQVQTSYTVFSSSVRAGLMDGRHIEICPQYPTWYRGFRYVTRGFEVNESDTKINLYPGNFTTNSILLREFHPGLDKTDYRNILFL